MKLSDEEFRRLWHICMMHAGKFGQNSLGIEDYASSAFEKLLKMYDEKVSNPGAWLKLVIANMLIYRANKEKMRASNDARPGAGTIRGNCYRSEQEVDS